MSNPSLVELDLAFHPLESLIKVEYCEAFFQELLSKTNHSHPILVILKRKMIKYLSGHFATTAKSNNF